MAWRTDRRTALQSGEVERIGGEGRLLINTADGKPVYDRMVTTKDHAAALAMLAGLPDGPMEKRGLIGSAIAWCMAARTWPRRRWWMPRH